MSDFDRVKRAVDIADVVGRQVSLKKQGRRLLGLCPFHAEKTPSFHVLPDQQFFKCFGCGKGGDVFVFLQELLGIEPVEALRMLAEQGGVELTQIGKRGPGRDRMARLREVTAQAASWFQEHAKERSAVFDSFLQRRKIEQAVATGFGIGLSPPGFRQTAEKLQKKGFELALLEDAGLGQSRERGFVDAFRDRLIIPIRDEHGRTVAFGARRLRDGDDAPQPKYLNSRDTPLFQKSQVLFALDLARESIRLEQRVVLVEGYLDVVLAHQAGLRCCVAALGTAITEEHARRMRRLASTVVLLLDGDVAGRRAARKAVPLLLQEGLSVRVLGLENGVDPGDYFASGKTAADFDALLAREGRSGLEYLLEVAGAPKAFTGEERSAVARVLLEDLAPIVDPLIRVTALQDVAAILGIPLGALEASDRRGGPRSRRDSRRPGGSPRSERGPADPSQPPGGPSGSAQARQSDPEDAEEGGCLPRDRHGVAELETLESLLRLPDLVHVVRDDPEMSEIIAEGTFRHPVRLRLFRALMAASSSEWGVILQRFPGDGKAQQLIQHLAFRSSETDPGKLFDGAVRFLKEERKEELGRQLKEDYRLEQRTAVLQGEQDPAGSTECGDAPRLEADRRFLAAYQARIQTKRSPQ